MKYGPPDPFAVRLVYRMAFAATASFATAELLRWDFSFFAPMLAVQILAAMPAPPPIRLGIAIPLIIFVANTLALAVSAAFHGTPGVLLSVVGLVIFWTFYGRRSGAPGVVMFLVQIAFCCVPVITTISFDLAHSFADALFWASIVAIITAWIAHLLFPSPEASVSPAAPPVKPPEVPQMGAGRGAFFDMLILMPILFGFILGGNINNIVILIIALNLLREVEPTKRTGVALALLVGNLLGGALGVLTYQFVILANKNFVFFTLSVLLASLWFGGRIARRDANAPVYAIAFATFILILGLGVSPLPMGSEEAFGPRIIKIMLATAYTIGALSLFAVRRERKAARRAIE